MDARIEESLRFCGIIRLSTAFNGKIGCCSTGVKVRGESFPSRTEILVGVVSVFMWYNLWRNKLMTNISIEISTCARIVQKAT